MFLTDASNNSTHSSSHFSNETSPLGILTTSPSSALITTAHRKSGSSSPGSGHLYEEEYLELPSVQICFLLCYVILITVGGIGNLFLIIYIWRSANFSSTNSASPMLILSLAVCDFFRSAVLTPLKFLEFLNPKEGNVMSDSYCRIAMFSVVLLGFAEFHSVVAVSQERLLLICFPFKAREWLSPRNVRLVMALIWLVSGFFALAFVMLLSKTIDVTLTSGLTYKLCTVYFFEEEPSEISRVYSTLMFIFYYSLPVLVVSVNYLLIFKVLVKKSFLNVRPMNKEGLFNKVAANESSEADVFSTGKQQRRGEYIIKRDAMIKVINERKYLAKMMMAITLCFAIFNSPVFLSYLYMGWGFKPDKNAIFWLLIVKFMPTVSSMFNPFVYCTRKRTLRRNFRNPSLPSLSRSKKSSRH